jgi:hypothetical protein
MRLSRTVTPMCQTLTTGTAIDCVSFRTVFLLTFSGLY